MLTYAINPSGASGLRRLTALAALTALALPSAVALAQSGLPAWIEPPEGSVRFGMCVASGADLTGDGIDDVIIADPGFETHIGKVGRWSVYDSVTREVIWSVPGSELLLDHAQGAQNHLAAAFIDDLDNDGVPDVLIGALDRKGAAEVYSGRTGDFLWRVEGQSNQDYVGIEVARLGDLNFDGVDEFCVVGSGLAQVLIFSGRTGELFRAVDVPRPRRVRNAGDVNGDDVADIVVGCHILGSGDGVRMYSGLTGEMLWHAPRRIGFIWELFGYNLAAGHDLDGDDIPDVLAMGTSRGWIHIVSGATGAVSSMDLGLATQMFWIGLGDLNGDVRVEPIVGYFPGSNGLPVRLHVFDHFPGPDPIERLAYTADWTAVANGTIWGNEMTVADVTGDGCDDLILGSDNNTGVHIIGGSPMLFGHDLDTYAAFGEREVRRGFTHRFAAVGNAVGRPVRLAVSRRGNGCTFIPQLGICLDLDRPFQQVAQAITDADGFARFSIPIPADTTPGPVWMQCLDINFPRRGPATSNVMRIEIVE